MGAGGFVPASSRSVVPPGPRDAASRIRRIRLLGAAARPRRGRRYAENCRAAPADARLGSTPGHTSGKAILHVCVSPPPHTPLRQRKMVSVVRGLPSRSAGSLHAGTAFALTAWRDVVPALERSAADGQPTVGGASAEEPPDRPWEGRIRPDSSCPAEVGVESSARGLSLPAGDCPAEEELEELGEDRGRLPATLGE